MSRELTYEEQMARPRRMVLLCSYCGGDRVQCSDDHPCADCLVMCNTYMIAAEAIILDQYAGTLPGIVQGDKPLKKRLPAGWKTTPANSVGTKAEGRSAPTTPPVKP